MSSKSTKTKIKMPKVPRSLDEIMKAYSQLCAAAGQKQYQISVITKELADLNEQLRTVNNEAAARQQLDAQKAEPQETQSTEAAKEA